MTFLFIAGRSAPISQKKEVFGLESASAKFDRLSGRNKPAKNIKLFRYLEQSKFLPLSPKTTGRTIVLMYHDAVQKRDGKDVWFDTTPTEFMREVQTLRQQGATFISLDRLRDHLTKAKPLPKLAVALTFDDSYIGFYKLIYPILKKEKIPATMFVHTGFIGTTGSRPKMGWAELRQLDREGLVTIGAHSVSHPADLSKLSPAKQRKELEASKHTLEYGLGHPVLYVSYPNGMGDVVTWKIAREVGFVMGFMEDWHLAEETPDMLAVSRYIQIQLPRAIRDASPQPKQVGTVVEAELRPSRVRLEYSHDLALTIGGIPQNQLSGYREDVMQFIKRSGAIAGINGTFFADPLLKSNDNTIVGPIKSLPTGWFIPERNPYVLVRILGRPLVAWNRTKIVFTSFKIDMNLPATVETILPNYSNAFVGGAWIVHSGKAVWPMVNPPSDAGDFRPRVFFGYKNGDAVLGASLRPMSTRLLSQAASAAGIQEAVLLDSGYSSSLIFRGKRLVVGRTWDKTPSRPVPHAIVLMESGAPLAQR